MKASGPVEAAALDSTSGLVAVASPLGVEFFDAKGTSDAPQRVIRFFSRALGVSFQRDLVASAEQDGCARIYSVCTDQVVFVMV